MRCYLRWLALGVVASATSMATAQLIDLGATYPSTGFTNYAPAQYPSTPHPAYQFAKPTPPAADGPQSKVAKLFGSSVVPPAPAGFGAPAPGPSGPATNGMTIVEQGSYNRYDSQPTSVQADVVAEASPVPDVAPPQSQSIIIPQQGSVDMGTSQSSAPFSSAPMQNATTYGNPSAGGYWPDSVIATTAPTTCTSPGSPAPVCSAAGCDSCSTGATATADSGTCDAAGTAVGSGSQTACNTSSTPKNDGAHGGGLLGRLHGGSASSCGPDSSSAKGHSGHGLLMPKLGDRIAHTGSAQCRRWFGGMYYLNLWRDDDNFGTPLAVSAAATTTPVLSTGMARMESASGVGGRVGRMLNANTAVEGVYWQAFPNDPHAIALSSTVGANINSLMSFAGVDYLGTPVDDLYQDSPYQEVSRSYEFRNFEVNLLRLPYSFQGSNGPVRLALLAGARYFNASDCIDYFADDANEIRGDDPLNEISYVNKVRNHMVGFQLGGVLDYCLSDRLSGQLGSKFGLFNNRMEQEVLLGGDGGGAVISAGPAAGQSFALENQKDDVAFLAEFDAGISYCLTPAWRLSGGYKVLAVSGYADSVSQFPNTFTSLVDAAEIKNHDSLILHGIYAGIEYSW